MTEVWVPAAYREESLWGKGRLQYFVGFKNLLTLSVWGEECVIRLSRVNHCSHKKCHYRVEWGEVVTVHKCEGQWRQLCTNHTETSQGGILCGRLYKAEITAVFASTLPHKLHHISQRELPVIDQWVNPSMWSFQSKSKLVYNKCFFVFFVFPVILHL